MTTNNPHHSRRWTILAILAIAQLMVVLDATIVNIALPSAQRALHFANSERQWIVTAYALAFGSLLLLGGRISDLLGRKWTFIVGLAGFATASAVGGAAQSCRRADNGFVDAFPERGRPHEGLVVEAGREEGCEQRIDRKQIEAKRWPAILARGLEPVEHFDRGRARVWLAASAAAQFHKRIRFFRAGGENAARAVIFETAADQTDAVRQQRGCERIAGESVDLATVKISAQRQRPIDQSAAEAMWLNAAGKGRHRRAHGAAL